MSRRPPSMDEQHIPSPPIVTQEQYDAMKAAGINRFGEGKPYDRTAWELHRKACEEMGVNPEEVKPHYHKSEEYRLARYTKAGIDPLNQNPDGSDFHLMNTIDAEIDGADGSSREQPKADSTPIPDSTKDE